ncbi:MAG: Ig-like domain-containing protein [Bacteroidales bacterium]|nr:Ig-like domain-containing protein [Bacteroidales bacterium]
MRKFFNTILALAAGIGLFVSCQEKVEDLNFATTLKVDKDAVELTSAGDQVQLQLTANGDWIAVAPDWLHVEPGSGSGNAVLTVYAPVNENEFQEMMGPRNQKLYIYGEGVKIEIPIKQAGLAALDATRTFKKISSAAEFEAGKAYMLVFSLDDTGTLYAANAWPGTPGNGRYEYWCQKPPVVVDVDGTITRPDGSEAVRIIAVDGGYILQEPGGGFLYQGANYATSFYAAATADGGDKWTVSFNEAGQAVITNITSNNGTLQYLKGKYQEFACYPDYPAQDCHPIVLYKDEAAASDEVLTVADLTVEADATSASIPVNANKEWSVRNHDAWITSFAKNEAGNAIDVTFDVNTSATAERTATFTVIGETTNKVITLTQKAAATIITAKDKTVAVGRTTTAEVTCNTDGEKSYVSKNTAIATVDKNGVITGVAEGETQITVTVAATDLYPAASKDFKVTVTAAAAMATTVAGITEQIPDTATGSGTAVNYEAELTGAVVSYVNGNNAYIEDASGAILLYMSGHGLKAGDVISGKVSGTGYKYNGLPEITAIGTEFTKAEGGTIPLTEITLANLISNFNANMSRRVVIKGVKVTDGIASGDRNGKISQGDKEMALYDQSKKVVLAADAEGDLIAYPCIRIANGSTTLQLSVWQTSDFTPAGNVETTLTANDVTVQVGKTVNADVTTNSPGALSYVSDNTQIATVDAQGVITGVAEGEANITVTVAASGAYDAKSATFKVTVTPAPTVLPSTVAGITAQIPDTATGSNTAVDYEADLTGAVVSYVNGNSAYIEDASGAILLYMSGHGLKAGDVISGKVSGKGYKYNGLPEITAIGTEFTKAEGGTIPLTEITLADLIANFDANMSRRIVVKGVKVTDPIGSNDRNGKISQNGSEIALYDQSKKVVLAADAEGDLIAYPCIRIANGTTTLQLSVWQTADFTVGGGAPETTITAVDKTVQVGQTVDAEVTTNSPGALSYVSDNTQIATVDAQGVITGVAEGEANITVTVAASGDYASKSATFKVTVTAAPVVLPSNVAGIIAQIPDTATGSSTAANYEADLTGAVVTYVNGNNAFIEDESGAILLYLNGHGLTAGTVISGKVSGKGYKYNGLPEIVSIGSECTKTPGGTIPKKEITIADLLADFTPNISRRVVIKGVKVTDPIASGDRNGKISQGNDEIALYDQTKNVVLAADAQGDLIAFPCIRIANGSTTLQLSVFESGQFIPAGSAPVTTLTAEDLTVQAGTSVQARITTNSTGAITLESNNEQVATVSSTEGVWSVTGVSAGEAEITVSLAASGDYVAKSTTFKVTVTAAPSTLSTTVAGVVSQITATSSSSPSSYEADLAGAVVTYVNGKNAYIEDASGAILLYMNNHGLIAGDVISGKISGTGYKYNGLPEITAIGTEYTKSTGGTIPATEMTVAQLVADFDANMSRRIVLKGVTVTDGISGSDRDGEIDQGGNKVLLRAQNTSCTIDAGSKGNLIAFPLRYTTSSADKMQLAIWTNDQFTVTSVSTTLTAKDVTVQVGKTVNADVTTNSPGALSYSSDNTQIATVDAQGVITGVAEGEANITVTVAASGDYGSKSATFKVTVVAAPTGGNNYAKYSGSITEGDYIIYYNGKAMKNTIASNRFGYAEVTPSADVISEPDASIVWHISASGDYWVIYNAAVQKYAGSTGSKNQGKLLDAATSDNALWTVTGSATYEFENKARAAASSDPNNKWLRNNGTYGFACYATSTGGALTLYKKQ